MAAAFAFVCQLTGDQTLIRMICCVQVMQIIHIYNMHVNNSYIYYTIYICKLYKLYINNKYMCKLYELYINTCSSYTNYEYAYKQVTQLHPKHLNTLL